MKHAIENKDPLLIKVWFLYLYMEYPTAMHCLGKVTNPALIFLLKPYLKMRFCFLFSTPTHPPERRTRIAQWLECTFHPIVTRAYHLLWMETSTSLKDHFFIQRTMDYKEEDGLCPIVEKWTPKTFEEWESFSMPEGTTYLTTKLRDKNLAEIASKCIKTRGDTKVFYPLFCNLTAADINASHPYVACMKISIISHSFANRKDGIKTRHKGVKKMINKLAKTKGEEEDLFDILENDGLSEEDEEEDGEEKEKPEDQNDDDDDTGFEKYEEEIRKELESIWNQDN